MAAPVEYAVQTQYGKISVLDSQGDGPAALFIHGNSACKEVFRKQFESNIGRNFRLIAIDLPGHGKSENARDAEATYSLPGYAECISLKEGTGYFGRILRNFGLSRRLLSLE